MEQQPPQYGQRFDASQGEVPVCPRHPDRPSYVNCSRCGRPACSECQVQTPVGMHCVDCAREERQEARRRGGAGAGSALLPRARMLPVTWSVIVLCVLVYVGQVMIPGHVVINALAYNSVWTFAEPWRALTTGFVHGSVMHLLMNMYTLYIFGQALEPRLGSWRFLVVYLLSILGGSAAVFLWAPGAWVVGASGGIFGLFGAFFSWTRFRGGETRSLVTLILVNLVFGFLVQGISWQAHVGGLVTGAVVAFLFDLLPHRRRPGV